MHTAIVIAAGLFLLAVCVFVGHLAGAPSIGALAYLPLWFVGAGVNMCVGVRKGYTFAEEAPVFVGVFLAPAVIALLVWWRMRGS